MKLIMAKKRKIEVEGREISIVVEEGKKDIDRIIKNN